MILHHMMARNLSHYLYDSFICLLTPAQVTRGRTIALWIILVNGVNFQTIRLVYACQKKQLMAIHVKITRYESFL